MHDAINICESGESPEVKRSLGARVESAFTVAALFAVRFTSLAARVRTREKFENGRRNRLPHQRKSFVCKGRIGFSLSILAAIPIFSQLLSKRPFIEFGGTLAYRNSLAAAGEPTRPGRTSLVMLRVLHEVLGLLRRGRQLLKQDSHRQRNHRQFVVAIPEDRQPGQDNGQRQQ
jgi:hypothetical protein